MSLKWLETYSSENTVNAYRWAIRQFFECLGFKGNLEESVQAYFSQKRSYEEDIKAFFTTLKDKPPKTVNVCLIAVKMLLMENGVELPAIFWRRLKGRSKGTRALMLDKVPSNAELRRILSHMDIKGKSLFLVLASSGMRIGEALKLKVEDVDLTSDPARINIRGEYTKTGNPRIAFISFEAKEALEEWLRIRSHEFDVAVKRSRYGKELDDSRIWPFEAETAYFIWRNAVSKSGFDKRFQYNNGLERFTVHPHVLRKFFRTKMGSVIPVDVVEALMGHEGYLTDVYRRYSIDDLAKFYKQGEPAVLVFAEAGEVMKIRREMDERFEALRALNEKLQLENLDLRKKLEEQSKRIDVLEELAREAKAIFELLESKGLIPPSFTGKEEGKK